MLTGNRFRCYPTKTQEDILLRWIGCQRFIYNSKVLENRYFRKFAKKSLSLAGYPIPVDQQYAQFIGENTVWLRDVPSQVLRNGANLWFGAYSRYFRKLSERPKIHKNYGEQSVWLTSELFRFDPVIDQETGEITRQRLIVGTKKYPVGGLRFKTHKPFEIPKSIHISVHAGRWHVSFCHEDGNIAPSKEETITWLQQFSREELAEQTLGFDRGVVIPLAGSNGTGFDISDIEKERIQKKERYVKRWQRIKARRQKGSSRYRKAKYKIAQYKQYAVNVRTNFAHQTSRTIVKQPDKFLFVFEDLAVQNMVRKPKAKKDTNGKFIKNGRRAKAGLNRSILSSSWGNLLKFTTYKAERLGKLVLTVPAHHTSQTCSQCGYIHQDNRIDQSRFVCHACGHQDNADINAARVIAQRGIKTLLDNAITKKEIMRCGIHKGKPGQELAEGTPVESQVRRAVGDNRTHGTLKRETPARALA